MKKVLLLLSFLFMFIVLPVNARELNVCRNCDYTTVDAALTAIEGMETTINEEFYIYVDTWDEQIVNNHTIDNRTIIDFNKAVTLKGNGSTTITLNNQLELAGKNINFTDFNFVVPDVVMSNELQQLGALLINAMNLRMSNIGIQAGPRIDCYGKDIAVLVAAKNVSIENSEISGFTNAIYSQSYNLNVDNCLLQDNIISIRAEENGFVKNSNLSSIYTSGDFVIDETNEINGMKVKNYVSSQSGICLLEEIPGIYLDPDSSYVNISIIRSIDINLSQTKEVKNMLNFFREEIETDGFTFTIDDESIGTVNDGNIKLLKTGVVTVIAKNEDTRETYTLKINITNSVPNNPKTSNPVFYIGLIGFIILMISYAFYNYQINKKTF